MKRLKKFSRGFLSRDWFDWFLFAGYTALGVVGGLVWSEIAKAVRG